MYVNYYNHQFQSFFMYMLDLCEFEAVVVLLYRAVVSEGHQNWSVIHSIGISLWLQK